MSKFKVGDKVRVLQHPRGFDNTELGVGNKYEVLGVSNSCETLRVHKEPAYWWHQDRFELVEEVKPVLLIDGPGLYRTRGGEEVTIVGPRTERDLYPDHTWLGHDGECYRPDGRWTDSDTVESIFDIVEKISSTPEAAKQVDQPLLRQFASGATRNLDNNKLDYEGFLSPLVIEAFGKYMHSHRLQKDGTMRSSDNWQLGIGFDVYMKSGWRHFFDWWKLHRGLDATSPEDGHQIDKVEALCALMFNVQGYLHELLKEQSNE